MPFYQQWTPITTLHPFLSTTFSIPYVLYILAYPPRHRGLAFALLCVPTTYAFVHHLELTPCYSLNDTFGRMLYIWLAYMSYAFLVVQVSPNAKKGDRWRARLRWAGKVLYTRHLGEYYTPPISNEKEEKSKVMGRTGISGTTLRGRREPTHHLSRLHFCLRHLAKASLFLAINYMYDTFLPALTSYPPSSFIRRLPTSLDRNEFRLRTMMTWDVCIADMPYFSSIYSIFAILWVCIFRLDSASEWSLTHFGPLTLAYSVRRYWGVYLHDYINASFTAHIEIVTRGWLSMKKTDGHGEIWTAAVWYSAQMIPIIIEGAAQHLWFKSSARLQAQALFGKGMLIKAESAVGYGLVFCWKFWSVPEYLLTRHAWEMEYKRMKYPELSAGRSERVKIDLGGLE